MADPLIFPRLIYKGDPDTLGTGSDADGKRLDSQTKQVDSQDALDEALKDGWRLERDAPAKKGRALPLDDAKK